jgi:hypothetical protein
MTCNGITPIPGPLDTISAWVKNFKELYPNLSAYGRESRVYFEKQWIQKGNAGGLDFGQAIHEFRIRVEAV